MSCEIRVSEAFITPVACRKFNDANPVIFW